MSSDRAEFSAKLVVIDQVAGATLSRPSQVRYAMYRDALVADQRQDREQLMQTLWLFLWNLSEGHSVNGMH